MPVSYWFAGIVIINKTAGKMKKTLKKKIDIVFTLVILALCVVLWIIPTGFENPALSRQTLREKAKVIQVDNSHVEYRGLVAVGSQNLLLEILSGDFAGDTVEAGNILMGRLRTDKFFKDGDIVLSILKVNKKSSKVVSARAEDLYRINTELILLGLFAVFLIVFAKWTGFKALISFLFTALAIWKVLIPLFLKGVNPLAVSLLIVTIATAVIIFLISGFSRKGLVAFSGSVAGIGITTILALVFGHFFRISGTVQEYAETLLYSGYQLNLTDIFLAGIFISAAGAVMDVAMDIATAQNELVDSGAKLDRKGLIASGFKIAKPVIGTMTTTLLFAYSGSFTFLLMMFMAQGTPVEYIFNINYIAAEILYTLVGSFGLVLVAPITAIIGAYVYNSKVSYSESN